MMQEAQETQDTPHRQQDHLEMMALLRETENLARMEELRSRQELDVFIENLEHERRIQAALRQQEKDRLWERIAERQREESRLKRLESLKAERDIQALRTEIDDLKAELDKRSARRTQLKAEIAGFAKEPSAEPQQKTPTVDEENPASVSMKARNDMLHSTGVATAEWALAERMDERLESLLSSLQKLAETQEATDSVSNYSDLDLSITPQTFTPTGVVVASKGLSRLDGFPPKPGTAPMRLHGFHRSIRSLSVVFHPDGNVPILLAGYRGGVAHLDPESATIIANYPLDESKRYACNASGFLADGRLIATHSQMGLVAWQRPDTPAIQITPTVTSARLLRLLPGKKGAVFASDDKLYCFDATRAEFYEIYNHQGRTITSLELAGQVAILGDAKGAVVAINLTEAGRPLPPLLVGEKIYTLSLLDWRESTWIAAGVKRRTGLYVILTDLRGEQPERLLNVPERPHALGQAGPGKLLAAGERYLSYWDLNISGMSQIVSLADVAPVQDFALVRH